MHDYIIIIYLGRAHPSALKQRSSTQIRKCENYLAII